MRRRVFDWKAWVMFDFFAEPRIRISYIHNRPSNPRSSHRYCVMLEIYYSRVIAHYIGKVATVLGAFIILLF